MSPENVKKINEAYQRLHTYAAVARETGFSPATVKKYIINGYETVIEEDVVRFTGNLPVFDPAPFRTRDWGTLCTLSKEERKEIRQLWKEIVI